MKPLLHRGRELVRRRARDPLDQVGARHAGDFAPNALGKLLRRGLLRREEGAKSSLGPDVTGQSAGIDPLETGYTLFFQIIGEGPGRPVVARDRGEVPDDQRLDLNPRRFLVLPVDSVVSDVRISEGDELPAVGGIGEDFLVSREAGVEDDLAFRLAPSAERYALEDPSVFENQVSLVSALH